MRNLRRALLAAILVGLAVSGSRLYAQDPADPLPPGEPTPDLSVPMERQAQISPAEMDRSSREISGLAEADQKRVEELKAEARKQKDVIKLNCINDKLLQIKQLLNIVDDAASRLALALASADESERYHRYTVIRISGEKITVLRGEAEACVGEEISYLGPLDVDVDEPDVPDDPTVEDPFDDDMIDEPGYASPFS